VDIVMTRSAERTSITRVHRDDGVTLALPSQVPLRRLPHDLAHFVVEQALGLTSGFWGAIAGGAVFGGTEVFPRRRTSRVQERSRHVMKRLGSRITEAESLVGTVVRIYERRLDRDWAAARRLLTEMWQPARPSRERPGLAEVRRVCEALAEAEDHWLALAIGETVTLRWPRERAGARQRRRPPVTKKSDLGAAAGVMMRPP
jgi:hypothetical protein